MSIGFAPRQYPLACAARFAVHEMRTFRDVREPRGGTELATALRVTPEFAGDLVRRLWAEPTWRGNFAVFLDLRRTFDGGEARCLAGAERVPLFLRGQARQGLTDFEVTSAYALGQFAWEASATQDLVSATDHRDGWILDRNDIAMSRRGPNADRLRDILNGLAERDIPIRPLMHEPPVDQYAWSRPKNATAVRQGVVVNSPDALFHALETHFGSRAIFRSFLSEDHALPHTDATASAAYFTQEALRTLRDDLHRGTPHVMHIMRVTPRTGPSMDVANVLPFGTETRSCTGRLGIEYIPFGEAYDRHPTFLGPAGVLSLDLDTDAEYLF